MFYSAAVSSDEELFAYSVLHWARSLKPSSFGYFGTALASLILVSHILCPVLRVLFSPLKV